MAGIGYLCLGAPLFILGSDGDGGGGQMMAWCPAGVPAPRAGRGKGIRAFGGLRGQMRPFLFEQGKRLEQKKGPAGPADLRGPIFDQEYLFASGFIRYFAILGVRFGHHRPIGDPAGP